MIAMAGLSAASAAGAFTSEPDAPPGPGDPEVEESRIDMLRARRAGKNNQSNILAGEAEDPQVQRPTLLGGS
jgi:hypothetical protein